VLVACTAHVYARPFAHTGECRSVPPSCITRGSATADETGYTDAVRVAARADANVAEMATLFATMLTLLVGMGTIKVQDDAGNTLTDPTKQEHSLTQAEAGAFYVIICASRASLSSPLAFLRQSLHASAHVRTTTDITMALFCTMTVGIIVRRLGGVVLQVQRGNQRPFRPKFPDPLAGGRYSSLKARRAHLEQQARDVYDIEQSKIDEVAGRIGIPGDKALIALMKRRYEESPKPTGLPDEISEMVRLYACEMFAAAFHAFSAASHHECDTRTNPDLHALACAFIDLEEPARSSASLVQRACA
jgi:hypothetical protein